MEKLYFSLSEGAALSVGADLDVKDLGVALSPGATAELSGGIQTDGTLVQVGKDSRVSVTGDLGYLQINDRDGAGSVNVDGNMRYISLRMDAANAEQWTVHLEGGLRRLGGAGALHADPGAVTLSHDIGPRIACLTTCLARVKIMSPDACPATFFAGRGRHARR